MNNRAAMYLRRDARAWFGGGVIVLLLLAALFAPLLARHNPYAIDLVRQLEAPSREHWLGTWRIRCSMDI